MTEPIPLSILLKIARERQPARSDAGGDTLIIQKPLRFSMSPERSAWLNRPWELKADYADDARYRVAYTYTGPVVLDFWEIERDHWREFARMEGVIERAENRWKLQLIAMEDLSRQLAEARADAGYSADNSPAPGGGK